jgi:uncharacterized protein YjlB
MSIVEDVKKLAEKATGVGRPKKHEIADLVRDRKPTLARFADDGSIPNHPRWPLVHYRAAVALPGEIDPAAIFEDLFERNGWHQSWRNGVYDYLHYHSRIHEVMGVARGSAIVQFGGRRGRKIRLKAGDVVVLPAGTGHQCFSSSENFLVVGAYPATGKYDLCRTSPAEHARAVKTVSKVPPPRRDPIYGKEGRLLKLWKRLARRGGVAVAPARLQVRSQGGTNLRS